MKIFLALTCSLGLVAGSMAAPKKVVMLAGKPSHGPLSHEHNAGIQLLAKCLKQGEEGHVTPVDTLNRRPSDETIFEAAIAVVIYSAGGGGHPAVRGDNLLKLGKMME